MTVLFRLPRRSICAAPRKPTSMRPPWSQYENISGTDTTAAAVRGRRLLRLRADRAALVDEPAAWRVGPPREVRGDARQPDADEAHSPVVESPGRLDRHHLVGRVTHTGSRTCSCIHLWNVS